MTSVNNTKHIFPEEQEFDDVYEIKSEIRNTRVISLKSAFYLLEDILKEEVLNDIDKEKVFQLSNRLIEKHGIHAAELALRELLAKDFLVTALNSGAELHIEAIEQETDGVDWADVPQIPLPDEAPENYLGADKSGDIVVFLNRVYGPAGPDHPTRPNHPGWLDGKSMGRADLGKLDPAARKRLDNHETALGHKVPIEALNLPVQKVVRDRRENIIEREWRRRNREAVARSKSAQLCAR